jgi:hypothetical protein
MLMWCWARSTRTYNLNNKYPDIFHSALVYDGIQVQLIDIIALPRSNPTKATLLGIDNSGTCYCIPDETLIVSYLQVPDRSWNTITAIAYTPATRICWTPGARRVGLLLIVNQIPRQTGYFFESQVPVMLEQPSTWLSTVTTCTCCTKTAA